MTRTDLASPADSFNSCKLIIEVSLEEAAVVNSVWVDLTTRRVQVDDDPNTVDDSAITATIEAAGYAVN